MHFDVTIANIINALVISAGIGISLLCIIQINKSPINKFIKVFFSIFFTLTIVYVAMNLARRLMEGIPGEGITNGLYVITFIEFLLTILMPVMLSQMIIFIAHPRRTMNYCFLTIYIFALINIVILFISLGNHMLYSFDKNNFYHRENFFLLSYVGPVLMLLFDSYILVKYRKMFVKRVWIAFWVYIVAPLLALLFQAFFSEYQLLIFATVGAAVYMFNVVMGDLLSKYETQKLDASRIDAELSTATRIQSSMLPSIFPAFPERKEFDIYASMKPAKEVGGDFYDFFLIDENHLGIVIADVSGKGVPAALFMMACKILVQNQATNKPDPKAALEAVNAQICANNHDDMFVTVWLGIVDLTTGILTASNAGHEYPIIKQPNGHFEIYRDQHGLVIGALKDSKYTEYTVKLEKGAMLFLYTDGVAEANNVNYEQFTTSRILDALNSRDINTSEDALNAVNDAVNEFTKEAPQFDDLTMMCFKYIGK